MEPSQIKIKRVSTSQSVKPLVTWIMVTSLIKHRWWKRLSEFLSEDFPAAHIEFVIVGAQDEGFADIAYHEGGKIADAYSFLEGARARWENVVFVEAKQDVFNLPAAWNIGRGVAQGDIVIFRDADCMLLQYGFTRYNVQNLLKHKLGLFSVPSLSNGLAFKPKPTDITKADQGFPGLLLDATINGMSVCALKSVEEAVGGRNEYSPVLLYTNLSAKIARAGLVMGYGIDRGAWLATADDESPITLTDVQKNPKLIAKKQVAFALLNRFYNVGDADVFKQKQLERYHVDTDRLSPALLDEVNERYAGYRRMQALPKGIERFDFKPWDCLTNLDTKRYLSEARQVAKPYFKSVIERATIIGVYDEEQVSAIRQQTTS